MNPSIKSNLANLNDVLGEYQRLRKMTNQDVLEKQGGKLARNLRGTLKSIVRPKGYITAENLFTLAIVRLISYILPAIPLDQPATMLVTT